MVRAGFRVTMPPAIITNIGYRVTGLN